MFSSFAKFVSVVALVFCIGLGLSQLIEVRSRAESKTRPLHTFSVAGESGSAVNIDNSISPWLKLKQGKAIETNYAGDEAAIWNLASGLLRPVSAVSADFDSDGYPDVISGFAGTNGGVITLHKGWKEAFAPEDPQVLAGIKNGNFPVSFEKEARVLDIPISPDFIVTGKFVKDSTLDLIVGSRQSRSIYLLTSDDKDSFNSLREIQLNGEVTAIAADSFNPSKAYSGLVIATKNEKGFEALIFNGSGELNSSEPQRIQLSNEMDSIILANPDGLTTDKDLFLLGGGELSRIPQIGKSVSNPTTIDLPFRVEDFATGEFIRDRQAKTEIAILADNGSIYYLKNGSLDTRPFTEREMRASFAKNGRGRSVVTNSKNSESALANNWIIAEEHNLGVFNISKQPSQSLLRKSNVTGNETDDLLVVNQAESKIQILFKEPNYEPNRAAFTGETQVENIAFPHSPLVALPMRLNVMGQQGIVVLQNGNLEPTLIMFAPSATFTVSKTADTIDGTCNADCSLREAVVAANGAAGADMITFTPNGTHQLTIDNAGVENAAVEGDLDITQALTIVGNGTANTILQAGTTTANGIDKVLSVNPLFTSAFATSFTGFTVRFGRNPSTFATDGFGGGFDWEGSGTGTLTISNLIVTDNSTLDGDGGGITATSAAGNSFISVTGSTISNNDPDRSPAAASPIGGGIFVGTNTTFRLTNTTISNNNVNESFNNGQGGGIYAFGPANSGAGKSFLTGSTVSGNMAPSDGGGILSTQPIDFNTPTTISNNSSGRNGGGIWVNHTNGTTVLSEATMTGNSATTTGGAMYLSSATVANVLSVSFSRIVGNTGGGFRGLAVDGGTANVENNWWGCNTGPSAAPCDTAGVVGAGTVDFNPWLQLRNTAALTTLVQGQATAITASFLTNSAGTPIPVSSLDVLLGLPITFNNPTFGTLSGAQATIQPAGTATVAFTSNAAGATGKADATVDNGTTSTSPLITVTNTGTWDGSTSSDWNTATNWTTNFVPGTTNSVDLPAAGVTNQANLSAANATVANLTVGANRSLTISGGRTLTVNGSLTMSGNNIDATAGTLEIGGAGTVSRTSGSVLGPMRKVVTSAPRPAEAPLFVFTYPVGTATGFSPVTANFTAGSGSLTVAAVSGLAPSTPALNAATTLNRHWQMTETGALTASMTFSYLPADVAGTEANYVMIRSTAGAAAQRFQNGTPCPGVGSPCVDATANTIFASGVQSFENFWTAGEPLAPTSANVSVSGRVYAEGRGVSNAFVLLIGINGVSKTVRTSSFGYYRFEDVRVGETYVISVASKRYRFAPRTMNIADELADLDFVAEP